MRDLDAAATHDVFVSYTLRDGHTTFDQLLRIESALSRIGRPYVDLLHNESADPQRHVLEMLSQCDCLLIWQTPGYWFSEWTRLEVSIAAANGLRVLFWGQDELVAQETANSVNARQSVSDRGFLPHSVDGGFIAPPRLRGQLPYCHRYQEKTAIS